MRTEIYWIEEVKNGRLAIMPRPRGNEWLKDEIRSLKALNVDIVVSLLTQGENVELELEQEQSFCEFYEIEFIAFPIKDRQVPNSISKSKLLLSRLHHNLLNGKSIAVHCRGGIGRSGLITACLLIKSGMNAEKAFETVSKARRIEVPDTQEQYEWVQSLQDE
jgi:protein-tyrosine phosphatase